MPAPITVTRAGYRPELDREPPGSDKAGCGKLLFLIAAFFAVIVGVIGIVIMALSPQDESLDEQPMILTLSPMDDSGYGLDVNLADVLQATPTATMDYCWFLTPTFDAPTPIPVTPDGWALRGTQIALETGTPIPTAQPTQEPPKAWCNEPPTPEPTDEATVAPRWTSIPATPTPVTNFESFLQPTSTLFPTLAPRWTSVPAQPRTYNPGGSSTINQPPRVITHVVIEQVVVQNEVIVVVTSTAQPTATIQTPTITATATATATIQTPTVTATVQTPTATATATIQTPTVHTPTATATVTLTATATATVTPTIQPTEEINENG